MEYEALEPNPEDEFYDQMCSVAYVKMFNERSDYPALVPKYIEPAFANFPDC